MKGFVEMTEYVRVCEERDDLKERVRSLRADLGLSENIALETALRNTHRLTPAESKIVRALYQAKGRVLSVDGLLEAVPPTWSNERDHSVLAAWVSKIRAKIGHGAILTAYAKGFMISPTGIALVEALLPHRAAA